jgi:glutamate formiminotransferase
VHIDDARRGAACAEALVLGELIGRELGVPVFLYGALAGGRTRADLREGGPQALAKRIGSGELTPDFGPRRLHPTAGATLVAARPPLVAFNLLVDADLETAKRAAGELRRLEGVRALGLDLPHKGVQLSFNVEDYEATPLRTLIETARLHARVREAELVGLAPRAAFEGFPADVPIPGFDPERHLIESQVS